MHSQHNSDRIFTPFTALWRWLMTKPGQPCKISTNAASTLKDACSRPQLAEMAPGHSACAERRTTRQPLRVLRVLDADVSPAQIGRLRISGCMADVCAELDRLAAHEARLH